MKELSYVLLAGLSIEARSGYDLAQWFNRAASHYWSAHHSSIYPALAELEAQRLVEHSTLASDKGPPRKVYRLTHAGRAALLEWVAQPARPRETRDEQMAKALAYDLLPPKRAIGLLHEARAGYEARLDHYRALLETWEARGDTAPLGPRLTLLHGIEVQRGYIRWCDTAIALIEARAAR